MKVMHKNYLKILLECQLIDKVVMRAIRELFYYCTIEFRST